MSSTVQLKRYTGQELIDKLFKHYYMVRVPFLATKTIEEIKRFGVPKSGDKHIDNAKAGEKITTYVTIEQMVELYRNNIDIYILEQKDSVEIYNVIVEHINNWHQFLKTTLNANQVPIEDLTAMDEFSKVVLKFIRENNLHLLTKNESSAFFDYFKSLKSYTVENMVRSVDALSLVTEETKTPDRFQHDNQRSSFFKEKLAFLKRLENNGHAGY